MVLFKRFISFFVPLLLVFFVVGCNGVNIDTGVSIGEELENFETASDEFSNIFDNKKEDLNKEVDKVQTNDDDAVVEVTSESILKEETVNVETTQDKITVIEVDSNDNNNTITYVLNKNSKKFHYDYCSSAKQIKEQNKGTGTDRERLISQGYSPCKICKP